MPDDPMGSMPPVAALARARASLFTRRRFVRLLLGLGGISAIAALVACAKSPSVSSGTRILAGTLESLPVGAATVLDAGAQPAIVINTEQGVKAFSAICTHASCLVGWDSAENRISCPCHSAFFDPLTGAVLAGPPPAPLPTRAVVLEGANIYVIAT